MDQITPRGGAFTLVHYTYPLSDASPPEYRIACVPNMTEFHATAHHPNYQRSNSTAAVTCPACRRTEVYKKARERDG